MEGDGCEGLVFGLDGDVFFGFEGLVESVVVAAAVEDAAGVFVDDADFVVGCDDVVFVEVEEGFGFEGVVEVGDEVGCVGVVEVVDAGLVFDEVEGGVEGCDGFLFFVGFVVDAFAHGFDGGCHVFEPVVGLALGWS